MTSLLMLDYSFFEGEGDVSVNLLEGSCSYAAATWHLLRGSLPLLVRSVRLGRGEHLIPLFLLRAPDCASASRGAPTLFTGNNIPPGGCHA